MDFFEHKGWQVLLQMHSGASSPTAQQKEEAGAARACAAYIRLSAAY